MFHHTSRMLVASALICSPVAAYAHGGPDEGACREDFNKFCKNVEGESLILDCMKSHETELSADCKSQATGKQGGDAPGKGEQDKACRQDKHSEACKSFVRVKSKAHDQETEGWKDDYKACAADKQAFCKDVPEGLGRIDDCMTAHAKDLSAECRKARIKQSARKKKGKKDAEDKPADGGSKSGGRE